MIIHCSYLCPPDESADPKLHSFFSHQVDPTEKRELKLSNWVLDLSYGQHSFYSIENGPVIKRKSGEIHLYQPNVRFFEYSKQPGESFALQFSGGEKLHLEHLLDGNGFRAFQDSEGQLGNLFHNFCIELKREAGFFEAQSLLYRMTGLLNKMEIQTSGEYTWLERAKALIDKNCTHSLDIHFLAKEMTCSISSFSHKFTKLAGESPGKYAMRCRLSHADRLLLSGEPMKMIAAELGFCNEFHFSKVYRKYRQRSPSSIRRK